MLSLWIALSSKAFRRWANISIRIRIYKYLIQADKRIIEKMDKNVSVSKFLIKLGRLSDEKWKWYDFMEMSFTRKGALKSNLAKRSCLVRFLSVFWMIKINLLSDTFSEVNLHDYLLKRMVQLLNANMISLKDPHLHWNVKTTSTGTLLVVVSSLVRKNFNNNKDNNNNKNKIYLYCQVN